MCPHGKDRPACKQCRNGMMRAPRVATRAPRRRIINRHMASRARKPGR